MKAVRFSLRTRDPSDAKVRNGRVAAHLEEVWQALRASPTRLARRPRRRRA
ncbi:DUF6538 domain-containing protein [Bosea sp. (in: a-proteobacteria)]|uniref:DUF6538 domain-containing protein n=1 Tax=Bosea sp. (in: a-proteobacteria) TaxID=1871050 RepID=UPI0031FF3C50